MGEPIASYRNVQKSYGDVEVLKGIDLDIAPSEKVALIGPSGSGKTTIIRMLMTLERPTDGTIEVDGNNLWHMEKNNELVPANEKYLRNVRGEIGMVFQNFALFPHKTILENTEYGLEIQGIAKVERQEKAKESLKLVGLAGYEDQYPNQLSGGMQQRVGLARALANGPDILLMDITKG